MKRHTPSAPAALPSLEDAALDSVTGGCAACSGDQQQQPAAGGGLAGLASMFSGGGAAGGGMSQIAGLLGQLTQQK